MELAEQIAALRKKHGFSQEELGEKLGVSRSGCFQVGIQPGGAGTGKIKGTLPNFWSFFKRIAAAGGKRSSKGRRESPFPTGGKKYSGTA